MKKITFICISMILMYTSCSKPGCTDPDASNYDSSAKEMDNSCLYDLEGEWNLTSFILNGQESSSLYSVYRFTFYQDGSYYAEALPASGNNGQGGDWIDVWGISTLNSDQTTITLQNQLVDYYNGSGTISNSDFANYNISNLDYNNITIELISSSNPSISSLTISMYRD